METDFINYVFMDILRAHSLCRDEILKLFEKHNSNRQNEFLNCVYNIVKFIAERNATISVLVQQDLLWDAQIILRVIQEATMKVSYLCSQDVTEQKKRLQEYLHDLSEINLLKHSENSKKIIESINGNEISKMTFLPLIMEEGEYIRLKEKWPRKERQSLEQRWSYSEMIKERAKNSNGLLELIPSMLHPYRISSHLIHADETGVGIVAERAVRTKENKQKIESYHFGSILNNSICYFIDCGISLCNALKEDPGTFAEIIKEIEPTLEIINASGKLVFEDPIYDKYR